MSQIPYIASLNYLRNVLITDRKISEFSKTFENKLLYKPVNAENEKRIEKERAILLGNTESIPFIEYGAGSRSGGGSQRKISEVAKSSLSGPNQCRLIFNLVEHYKPLNILEIGTSFGISTSYIALGNERARVISLEGNPSSAEIATKLFAKLGIKNIDLKIGEFNDTLPESLRQLKTVDMAFLDGNHRKEATLDYFNRILSCIHSKSILLVDDIYWSKGMQEAWVEIKNHPKVSISIDLYRMGIVFFDEGIVPQQDLYYLLK